MRHRKIIGELYGTPEERASWKKRLEEERKRNREAMDVYRAKEMLRKQLTLDLGIPKIILCPQCHGTGCAGCRKKGVVEEGIGKILDPCMVDDQPSVTPTVECRRCWGVGKVALTTFVVKICPNCSGTGQIEAPID